MLMLVANRTALVEQHYSNDMVAMGMQKRVLFKMQKQMVFEMQKSHLPSLDETSPTTLPPIMPPMQKMATTKDQMKVTEVSQAVFRDSHSSRLPLVR